MHMCELCTGLILTHADDSNCDLSPLIFIYFFKAIPKESDTLVSSIETVPESTNPEMLAKGLTLIVPSSVKECRRAGAHMLTKKAENDVINCYPPLENRCKGDDMAR